MIGGERNEKIYCHLLHADISRMGYEKYYSSRNQKNKETWMAWMNRVGGGMVDMGTPLGNSRKVTKSKTTQSDSSIVGYSILQAGNMDEVAQLLQGHPHLEWREGCEIEIHESLPLPGM